MLVERINGVNRCLDAVPIGKDLADKLRVRADRDAGGVFRCVVSNVVSYIANVPLRFFKPELPILEGKATHVSARQVALSEDVIAIRAHGREIQAYLVRHVCGWRPGRNGFLH